MRFIVFFLLITGSAFAQSTEQFYQAAKYMIHTTTEQRLRAFEAKDLNKICNATGSRYGVDTMTYYLSFEMFEDPKLAERLNRELGYFYVRNLKEMYESRIPVKLHLACIKKDSKSVMQLMNAVRFIYIQESP